MTSPPGLTFVMTLLIEVGEPVDCGRLPDGHRRLIPILGGHVTGPVVNGRVLPFGVDDQILRSTTVTELDATYAVETEAGEIIRVHNTGIRRASAVDTAALVRGEPVPPERVYFRTRPIMNTRAPRLQWLNETVLLGTGRRRPTAVELDVFAVG